MSLHMLRLAYGYAQSGEIEHACSLATNALDIGQDVKSFRFDEVKGDLIYLLKPNIANRYVRHLMEKYRSLADSSLPRSRLAAYG